MYKNVVFLEVVQCIDLLESQRPTQVEHGSGFSSLTEVVGRGGAGGGRILLHTCRDTDSPVVDVDAVGTAQELSSRKKRGVW